MYICICNAITDKDIKKAICNGACSVSDLSKQLKVGTCCGKCKSCAHRLIKESVQTQSFPILTLSTYQNNDNLARL